MKKIPKNKKEALIIEAKRKHKKEVGTEGTLQASFVSDYNKKIGDKKLFAVVNENVGAYAKTIGVVSGVSDLIHCPNGDMVAIEVKHPEETHNRDHILNQANWLLSVPKKGYFCASIDGFWSIINGGEGICPLRVIEYLKTHKTVKFKIFLNNKNEKQ